MTRYAGSPPGNSYSIINGYRAEWISMRLFTRILFLALKHTGNPAGALRIFRRFAEKRKKIQGYEKITRYVKCGTKYYFADQIPGFPSEKFDRFFRNELIRLDNTSPKPLMMNTLIFAITSRCPLKCVHCFEWDNIRSSEHLQGEELMDIMEKLEILGLTHIQFGGGEPLIRFDDLLALTTRASQTMDCWILTSGYGLTAEKAFALKSAGLTGASISLDHWDETAHNQFRNHTKAFGWAREAVQNCINAGLLVCLAVCATREFASRENIHRYYDLARDWGASFVKILEARKTGRFRNLDVMPDRHQVEFLMDFYLNSYIEKAFRKHPVLMFPGFDQRQVGCLGAGNRYMYIDSKGEVHACPFCHGSAGNVLKDSLEDTVKRVRQSGCQVFGVSDF